MMSSHILVSRPYFDTRVAAQDGSQPQLANPETTVKENVYAGTSSGLATAGYRSAKYIPEEWLTNNSALLNRSVADRNHAVRICTESKALKAETDAGTLRTQTAGTKHLGNRLQDIHRFRSELEQLIERLIAETEPADGLQAAAGKSAGRHGRFPSPSPLITSPAERDASDRICWRTRWKRNFLRYRQQEVKVLFFQKYMHTHTQMAINRIHNTCFCLHRICVYYLLFVYKYKYMHEYIYVKYIVYI